MTDDTGYLEDLAAVQARHWPAAVPREIEYPLGEITLTRHVAHWAATRPADTAIVYYGAETSWEALDDRANRCAHLLAESGLVPGDRVAVFLPNCPQFHIAFYGILRAGMVHVPVSPLSTPDELDFVLKDTGARALVTLDTLVPVVEETGATEDGLTVFSTALAEVLPEQPAFHLPASVATAPRDCPGTTALLPALERMPADPVDHSTLDAIAALNFTGGTTGMPKGCIHTQRDMVFTGAANWSVTTGRMEGVTLSFMPEFWIAGENAALIFPVMTGEPLVLLTRWDPLGVLQAIQRYRVTTTAFVVDGAVELMNRSDFGDYDLSSLRRVRVVSFIKKLDADIRARWKGLTGTVLAESSWGMTETHTSNTFTTAMQEDDFDLRQRPVFVGLPLPGNEIVIRDFDSGRPVPLGEEGEITIRSPAMLKGYWQRPDATAEAIRNGFLHSGDIGVIDEMGFLHYLGRRKEMLKVRGMSVFPAELEAVLGKHPGVGGSGVVGRSDAHAGQIPVAFVMPSDPGLTAEALTEWLSDRVSKYKLPEIRLVEALPMTATNKVRKAELAKWVETKEPTA
ncbi:acyl-CoA synthetase [Pseudooceanicola nanhaiensis]|jgi:fatty-acyl-CoA synthase|uniref:Acyl-CoA synthetase n=2 Tax=Pseudooceanicola nanhaiensis TaxID=375761 RepID=A0A917T0S0_9RHOB|nr:AMP-binding protein [Pseudooceanicola nanhaiensis]GGM04912.1 acyl-CoA synthetase [Pseudooceanicola nanhaiensis]